MLSLACYITSWKPTVLESATFNYTQTTVQARTKAGSFWSTWCGVSWPDWMRRLNSPSSELGTPNSHQTGVFDSWSLRFTANHPWCRICQDSNRRRWKEVEGWQLETTSTKLAIYHSTGRLPPGVLSWWLQGSCLSWPRCLSNFNIMPSHSISSHPTLAAHLPSVHLDSGHAYTPPSPHPSLAFHVPQVHLDSGHTYTPPSPKRQKQ